jgi:hypothetical protein
MNWRLPSYEKLLPGANEIFNRIRKNSDLLTELLSTAGYDNNREPQNVT